MPTTISTPADYVNRATDAGTMRFNVPVGNGTPLANLTIGGNASIGNLTELVGVMALGNSANATLASNATILFYDGAVAAGNLVHTLAGNTATASQLANVYGSVKAPLKNGSLTVVQGANCPQAWFSVFGGGTNGQNGNQSA